MLLNLSSAANLADHLVDRFAREIEFKEVRKNPLHKAQELNNLENSLLMSYEKESRTFCYGPSYIY